MAPGAWLVSLEFAVPDVQAHAQMRAPDGRPVWVYRMPGAPAMAWQALSAAGTS
jgi:hypothetical protein